MLKVRTLAVTCPLLLVVLLARTCSAQSAGDEGVFDGSVLPVNARPEWTRTNGKADEAIINGQWVVQSPMNFMRGLDLGPARRSTGKVNVIDVVWGTDCRNNANADGFCLHTHGRRLRLQPIHRPHGADLLLTGSPGGLSPDIKDCRIDLSNAPDFDATRLNRYTIRWVTDAENEFLFELSVNGRRIAELPGTHLPVKRASLSFEFRTGRQTIDEVSWELNRGGRLLPPKDVAHAQKLAAAGHRQLFLDDALIERMKGLNRVVNPPKKYAGNPVIRHHQTPWQTFRAQLYGTVLYIPEERLFKMWYLAGARFPGEEPIRLNGRLCCPNFQMLAYAESKNGFDWTLPNLGLVEFDGSQENNICRFSRENAEGVAVVYDVRDPNPQRRYKAFYWEHDSCGPKRYGPTTPVNGMSVSFSADGKTWTNEPGNPVIEFASDTGQQVLWDEQRQRYVAFGRFNAGGRKIARAESADFVKWSRPQLVFQTDADDGPGAQFYGMGITRYEGLYVGLPWMFREGTTDRIDVQLAMSRGGIAWKRVADRKTFIPNGKRGSFDAGCIFTANQPLQVVGDTIFIFYSGLLLNHEEPRPDRTERPEYGESSIGVATLRRDGFVSLNATDEPGFLVTKPLLWPVGKQLHLNTDARGGDVKVTVLNDLGEPLGNSEPTYGDRLDATIVWPATFDPPDRPVRLRFNVSHARLYSFWFGD